MADAGKERRSRTQRHRWAWAATVGETNRKGGCRSEQPHPPASKSEGAPDPHKAPYFRKGGGGAQLVDFGKQGPARSRVA
jgi:hypothetical protein